MVGTILGLGAIFGASEIAGEVYHSWHHNDEKNVIINGGRKLADYSEALSARVAEEKEKIDSKKGLKKASSSKNMMNSSKVVDEIIAALDSEINRITNEKDSDIKKVEIYLVESIIKVCDILTKAGNLEQDSIDDLAKIKNSAENLVNIINNDGLTNAKIKSQITKIATQLQVHIDTNKAIEEAKKPAKKVEEKTETKKGTFTVVDEEKKTVPDFTKPVKPLKKAEEAPIETPTKVSDVKATANKKATRKTTK